MKYLKFLLIISGILLIFIIFIIYYLISTSEQKTSQPKTYEESLNSVGDPSKIMHFPKVIPSEATNVYYFINSSPVFGGDIVYLRFNADKSYISNEIKKYNYIKIEGPFSRKEQYDSRGSRSHIFNIDGYSPKENILDITDFKLYVIGNKSTHYNCHPSCEYGIAVNKKTNTIIYYSSDPD